MIRLIGYVLAVISGVSLIVSSFQLVYQIFILYEGDRDSSFEDDLMLLLLALTLSLMIFFYVYKTGFGKTRLERAKEELETLKIKKEIEKYKDL